MNLKDEIINHPKILRKDGGTNGNLLRKGSSFLLDELYVKIIEATSFLSNNVTFAERVHCIMADITEKVLCLQCNQPVKFKNGHYITYCSRKCADSDPKKIKKVKATKLARYGDENYVNVKKVKATKLTRYGDENYNNRDKSKNTCQEKYGSSNYVETDEFKNKSKNTCQEKYGVKYYLQTAIVTEQRKVTCQKKYGVSHHTKTAEYKEKAKQSNLKKYGVEHYTQTAEFKNKYKNTCQEKYGVPFISQRHYSVDVISKLTKEYLIEKHHNQKLTQEEIALDIGVDGTTVGNYLRKYNIEVKYYNNSIPENEIADYIMSEYNTTVQRNVRSIIPPREIDIWIPAFRLGIEYNGFYWHRPGLFKNIKEWLEYHQSKELECNQRGILLLHLWELYSDIEKLIDNAILAGVVENNYTKVLKELYNIKESL